MTFLSVGRDRPEVVAPHLIVSPTYLLGGDSASLSDLQNGRRKLQPAYCRTA